MGEGKAIFALAPAHPEPVNPRPSLTGVLRQAQDERYCPLRSPALTNPFTALEE